jgi:predicted nucleic acid-binding protein
VQDFLFDANHVTALWNKEPRLTPKVRSIPPERKYLISQITRGELEAGHRMAASADPTKIAEFWKFVDENFYPLEPSDDTSRYYGEILGRLHEKYPKKGGKKTELWLGEIGVQVNDVWLVAEAWSHHVECVSHDNMDKIKEVLQNEILRREVRFDDWLA